MRTCADLEALAAVVSTCDWCPGVFSDGHRHKSSFAHSDLIVFDVDDGLTADEAQKRLDAAELSYLLLLSKSHGIPKGDKPACDRFRIVLPAERRITSLEDHAATWASWYEDVLPEADTKAKDAARFFYASPKGWTGNTGKPATVLSTDAPSAKQPPPTMEEAEARLAPWPLSERVRRAEVRLEALVKKGVLAVEGDRDSKTIRIARAIGHDFGLGSAIATDLLWRGWIPHCPHPWPLKDDPKGEDLTTKVENALDTYTPDHAYGYELLLTAPADLKAKLEAGGAEVPELEDGRPALSIPPFPQKDWDEVVLGNNTVPVLNERFRVLRAKEGPPTRITIKVDDWNQAQALPDDEPELISYLVGRYADAGVRLKKKVILDSVFYWRAHAEPLAEEPLPLTYEGDPRLSFCRLPWTPAEGEWAAWKEFTSRCSDPELVMAYVGACFTPENETRQALVLRGDGEDGKSTAIGVLVGALGSGGGSINDISVTETKRFLLSSLYGTRVVAYPDCKVEKFCLTSVFRSLVSGDLVPIEFKMAGAFKAQMRCKLIIGTNEHLQVASTRADQSRVLLVEVAPSKNTDDPSWKLRLREQLPAFVFECLKAYARRCPNHGKLDVGEVVSEEVQAAAEDSRPAFRTRSRKLYACAPARRLYKSELRAGLAQNGVRVDVDQYIGRAVAWLASRGVAQRWDKARSTRYFDGLCPRYLLDKRDAWGFPAILDGHEIGAPIHTSRELWQATFAEAAP